MEVKKIFEDSDLLAVVKPAGMVVNKSQTTAKVLTLQDWLIKEGVGEGVERNGIVHRLDKETSGVLVVAKKTAMMEALQRQFKNRETVKQYITLVHGKVLPREGQVNAPIARNPFNRRRFGVFVGGKESVSRYKVVDYYALKGSRQVLSLVEVKPVTGRTHQIRVHLKYLGYPVVADEHYAGRKTAKKDRVWCPRLFLHAVSLEIKHPKSGKLLKLKAEIPSDLKEVLKGLKKIDVGN